MIIRREQQPVERATDEEVAQLGAFELRRCSELGRLTQFGAYVETLFPGARSSNRHWHEEEDEFLLMLEGEATVVEDDGEHLLHPGDVAAWPAGAPNAHQVVNRSDGPCSYLICGTRVPRDVVHYPDLGRTLYNDGSKWRLESEGGTLIKEGTR